MSVVWRLQLRNDVLLLLTNTVQIARPSPARTSVRLGLLGGSIRLSLFGHLLLGVLVTRLVWLEVVFKVILSVIIA